MSREQAFARLRAAWDDCASCPLHEEANRVVHWRGSQTAKMLIVGEAPGAEEDQLGIPFVGAAGKKLDELLIKAKIAPGRDVFIANTVACRPPGNRDPKPEEIKACKPRFDSILKILDPRVILTLGAVASKTLAKVSGISKWRGEVIGEAVYVKDRPVPVVPTFHPSYLIRRGDDPETRAVMLRDIRTAWRIANA